MKEIKRDPDIAKAKEYQEYISNSPDTKPQFNNIEGNDPGAIHNFMQDMADHPLATGGLAGLAGLGAMKLLNKSERRETLWV